MRILYPMVLFCFLNYLNAQSFRILRPVDDQYQIHGGYLYAENLFGYPHKGVDFQTPMSTPIYSASDGIVDYKGYEADGAGYYVVIESEWNEHKIWLYYMHLSDYSTIEVGDSVDAGDQIALSGNTGNSTGPHMHFEIRQDSQSFNAYMNRRNPELWMAISGMGAICGRVPFAGDGARVDINPDPKPRPPYTTYSYSLTYTFDGKIGSDDIYQENYAIGEMKPGTYTITSINGYRRTVTVRAGQVINVDPTPLIEEKTVFPAEFTFAQNYPNPFNNRTTISFEIVNNEFVELKIYNAQGRLVEELEPGNIKPGKNEIIWDASGQASGLYFARLRADEKMQTIKMILVK